MDSQETIKERYQKEAETYRQEAALVNFDSEILFKTLLYITTKIVEIQKRK